MLLLVGRRGAGKSIAATELIVKRLLQHELVYANYPVEVWRKGVLFARAGYIGSLLDCVAITGKQDDGTKEPVTIVVDEAPGWCSSRDWQLLPPGVASDWQQSRKRMVQWVFGATHESRVDVMIRELVDWVLIMRRSVLVPRWLPLFSVTQTYFEDITEARRHQGGRRYWRWYPQIVFDAYATDYEVPAMDSARLKEYRQRLKDGVSVEDFIGETLVHPQWFSDSEVTPDSV